MFYYIYKIDECNCAVNFIIFVDASILNLKIYFDIYLSLLRNTISIFSAIISDTLID